MTLETSLYESGLVSKWIEPSPGMLVPGELGQMAGRSAAIRGIPAAGASPADGVSSSPSQSESGLAGVRSAQIRDTACLIVLEVPEISAGKRRRMLRAMRWNARETDTFAWIDQRRLCAVLPNTAAVGARAFLERVLMLPAARAHEINWRIYPCSRLETVERPECPPDAEEGAAAAVRLLQSVVAAPPRVERMTALPAGLVVRPLPRWKRMIDIFGAIVGLICCSWIMALAIIAIKLSSRGPVIFRQQRAGLGGRRFTIYKFRTMSLDAEDQKASLRHLSEQDGPAFKMQDDPRVTVIGRILRKTSIDELPQFWNVLRGDMSLVGPRPLPLDEAAACEPWQQARLSVTPGLTCIWQVRGRSRVTFDQWMRMDLDYIRRQGVLCDVALLLETVPAVLLRRGAQ